MERRALGVRIVAPTMSSLRVCSQVLTASTLLTWVGALCHLSGGCDLLECVDSLSRSVDCVHEMHLGWYVGV